MAFKPGQSGNPGGRPKHGEEHRERCRVYGDKALQKLVDAMDAMKLHLGGEGYREEFPDWKARIDAAKTILEHGYGKPAQAITGEDGGAIKVDNSAGLLEILKRLAGDK